MYTKKLKLFMLKKQWISVVVPAVEVDSFGGKTNVAVMLRYSFCSFLWLWFKTYTMLSFISPSTSWSTWLIPAIAATVVGVMYRYYMLEHKSSWVLASRCLLILLIWRPWNVWPKPPETEGTQEWVGPLQREKEGSILIKCFCLCLHKVHQIDSQAETLLNCLPSVFLCFIVTMPIVM